MYNRSLAADLILNTVVIKNIIILLTNVVCTIAALIERFPKNSILFIVEKLKKFSKLRVV